MKITVRRQGQTLIPWSTDSAKLFEKLPFTVTLDADIVQKRNGAAHRLYWQMCALLADALNDAPGLTNWTQVMVSDRLKLATGRADVILLSPALHKHYAEQTAAETIIALKPQSISFAAMDQNEFSEFLSSCMKYIAQELGAVIQEHPSFAEVKRIVMPETS